MTIASASAGFRQRELETVSQRGIVAGEPAVDLETTMDLETEDAEAPIEAAAEASTFRIAFSLSPLMVSVLAVGSAETTSAFPGVIDPIPSGKSTQSPFASR